MASAHDELEKPYLSLMYLCTCAILASDMATEPHISSPIKKSECSPQVGGLRPQVEEIEKPLEV
jgi:hypothetical protein